MKMKIKPVMKPVKNFGQFLVVGNNGIKKLTGNDPVLAEMIKKATKK